VRYSIHPIKDEYLQPITPVTQEAEFGRFKVSGQNWAKVSKAEVCER
jgi:hypothetical protein